jgi:hypothetical protein
MLILCFTAAAKPSSAKLLDEVISDPGNWDQMCSGPPEIPFDVPLPLYSLVARRTFSLSERNIARLRERRSEVVREIVLRLKKMDLAKSLKRKAEVPSEVSPETANWISPESAQLSGLLEIILTLHAKETLPELLRLEPDLDRFLEIAGRDGGASLPVFDVNASVAEVGRDRIDAWAKAYQQQRNPVFNVRVLQRDLLSVMAALLRDERFKPLLASDLEARYFKFLKREAEGSELRDIKAPADLTGFQAEWITFDPIYHLPVRVGRGHDVMPYTPKLRLEIRQFVSDYLNPAASQQGRVPNR